LSDYRQELDTLMTERFHIVAKAAIPVEYREIALGPSQANRRGAPVRPGTGVAVAPGGVGRGWTDCGGRGIMEQVIFS
jgi:hypothetical protein